MSEDDLAYYRRRLAEEEARAYATSSPAAKAAHRRLALLYWEKIELLELARRSAIRAAAVARPQAGAGRHPARLNNVGTGVLGLQH